MTDTPETDYYDMELSYSPIARELKIQRDAAIAERDEARSRFNEIDLCKNGQAPCKWSLKLIHERDEAVQALRNIRAE